MTKKRGEGAKKMSLLAMIDDDGDGIFGAEFGLDSDEETKVEEKEKRTFQSEEDFLQQKRDWQPKIETRKVHILVDGTDK